MTQSNPSSTLYSALVNFINTKKPGETYTSDEFKRALTYITIEHNTKSKWNGQWYRLRGYQSYFGRIGMIKNVRRGEWEVLYNIPSWLTLGQVETLLDYRDWTKWRPGKPCQRVDPAKKVFLKQKLENYKKRNMIVQQVELEPQENLSTQTHFQDWDVTSNQLRSLLESTMTTTESTKKVEDRLPEFLDQLETLIAKYK